MNPISAVIFCVLLGAPDPSTSDLDFAGPGWYRLVLTSGQELTLIIVERTGDRFDCQFQGTHIQLHASQIEKLVGFDTEHELPPEEEVRLRQAVGQLGSLDRAASSEASRLIVDSFPECRAVLHESLTHRDPAVRREVIKILGEHGEHGEDADQIARRLYDADRDVRRTAVFALRQFGPETLDELVRYFGWEPIADLRKLVVKTFERWQDPRVVKPLIDAMQSERNPGVRRFIARALRIYLGPDYGDDPAQWKAFYSRVSKRLERQIDSRGDSSGGLRR